jgi:hypothetical protein
MSRREFLAVTGGVLASAAVPSVLSSVAGAAQENTELSPLVLSSDLYVSPDPQRFVFAIARGPKFASFKRARVAFAAPDQDEGTVLDTRLLKEGLPRGRGVYRVDAVFDEPGAWKAVALTRGQEVPFAIEVKDAADAPTTGTAAPRVPSPTLAERMGVKPLCTRRPRCPLHDVSLDRVIGAGTPVVALFATPALCVSQYCGPVLDQLLELAPQYESRVRFVHVEIYRSNTGVEQVPTVEDWGLPSEPWLFAIDGAGTITGRLDGAFGSEEIEELLTAVAG